MSTNFKKYIKKEVLEFRIHESNGNHQKCIEHLGRAHILSQSSILSHFYVHWLMLGYAIRNKDTPEIRGQIVRLLVILPGHLIGRVPKGNIGWSSVGLTQEMPIPDDLRHLLTK
jgi:hypothetical protein